ncbi:MAG: hypothetical protein HYY84_01420 [Deltaproteobacteria bacterium]|nr:hypothetical protein [Deltaproteobacteria bacterium]
MFVCRSGVLVVVGDSESIRHVGGGAVTMKTRALVRRAIERVPMVVR